MTMMGRHRNGHGGRPLAASGFEVLIAEAAGLDAEVAAMNADRKAWMLSKRAFRDLAMQQAGLDEAALKALKAKVAGDPGLARDLSAACRELRRRLVDHHCNGPDRRIAGYWGEKAGAVSPLASVGCRPEALWALIADDVPEDAFGTATDLAAIDAAFGAKRDRLLVLKAKLEREWGADDVLIEPAEGEEAEARGYSRVVFRCLPDVTLGRDVADRLIASWRVKERAAQSEKPAPKARPAKREALAEAEAA
ncbi:MAG: hypothetical protein HY613_02455 [Candidatus Rokubacteria bacterium]|nr:hypothetical protein [Candidatus Rokubacteria bacterium]